MNTGIITICRKLLALSVLLGLTTAAQAQLYIATGSSGVTTWLNFSIDAASNQVSVLVDNTHAGVGGVTGTVTSLGFNVPTAQASSGSLLSTTGVPVASWSYFAPYALNNYDQDVGAGSGANVNGGQPGEGVAFGSTATFVFQFSDFSSAAGFLGENGASLKWQGLSTTNQSDEGFGNLPPIPEPSTYGAFGAASLIGLIVRRMRRKARAVCAASGPMAA